MSVGHIPCSPGGRSRWLRITDLGGRDYLLTFRWNQRAGRWVLDVATEGGDVIAAGRVLVPSMPVLRGVRDARAPEGMLVLLDTQAEREGIDDPTFTSLGARHLLVYLDKEDLP